MSSAKQGRRQQHPAAGENLDIDVTSTLDGGDEPGPEVLDAKPTPGSRADTSLDIEIGSATAAAEETIAGLPAVMLLLPLADPPDSQAARITAWHVDVQLRDCDTRRAFMRLWAGLDRAGARLKDGRRVSSYADAVKWICERVEAVDRGQRPEVYDAKHNPTFPGK
jgi:hypothetical protein